MASDITQASLNLTSDERRVYGQLFQQADTESLGVVTGDIAVKFFERTKLDAAVLGEIWQIADAENRGLLTPAGFSVALRLIGHCQAGRTPSLEIAKKPGPLPKFDGAAVAPPAQRPATPLQAQTTGGSIGSQSSNGPIRVPPLTPDKLTEYQNLFDKAGARNGLLGGDAARQMFEKARLPNDVLGRIWGLADIEQRGALNQTEFIIAMHLLTSMRNGSLRALPQTLPAGLYDAANRKGAPPAPLRAIPAQFTGQGTQRTQSPLSRSFPPQDPILPQATGNDWLVTPQDKIKFDQIFVSLDTSGSGHLNGDQAVQFFSNSGLSEDNLASIWDLADIRSEGRLNKDEFAVAMYLIRQQRGKTNDRDSLPSQLPNGLVPPSMRQQQLPPSQHTAPAFDNAAFSSEQPKSASEDLFGLDALAGEPPLPPQTQTPAPAPVSQPLRSPSLASSASFKPFQPTSSFGQNLTQQNTGSAVPQAPVPSQAQSQSRPPPGRQVSAADDLLGDNDPMVSSKLTDETTELANISNQVRNLRTQTQETQAKKQTVETNLSTTSTQKRDLETRLGLLRNQYEQEIRQVKSLEERLTTSRNDTQRLQRELAMIEGTYQDLQTTHQQTMTALDDDQRENASLKDRTSKVNAEIAQLRTELDKMKADLRQQKGLVAINKKQLTTSENEREKVQSEMTDVKQEQSEVTAALQAAKQAPTSGMASPASTNPFFRRPQPGVERAMSPSIFTQEFGNPDHARNPAQAPTNNFDNFFGPSSAAPPPAPPAPTTAQSASHEVEKSDDSATPSTAPLSSQTAASPSTSDTSERQQQPRGFAPSFFPPGMDFLRSGTPSSSMRANPQESHSGFSDVATPVQFASPSASVNGDFEAAMRFERGTETTPGAQRAVEHERAASPAQGSSVHSLSVVDDMPGAFPEATPMATPGFFNASHDQHTNAHNTQDPFETQAQTSEAPRPDPTSTAATQNTSSSNFFPSTDHTKPANNARAEFGRIDELGDSSDSESDLEFEDDFAPQRSTRGQPGVVDTRRLEPHNPGATIPMGPSDELPVPEDTVAEVAPSPANPSPVLETQDHAASRVFSGVPQVSSSAGTVAPQTNAFQTQHQHEDFTATTASRVPHAGATGGVDEFDAAFDDLTEANAAEDQAQELASGSARSTRDFSTEFAPAEPPKTTNGPPQPTASTTYSAVPSAGTYKGPASAGTYNGPSIPGAYSGPPTGRFSSFATGFSSSTPSAQTYSGEPKTDSFGSFAPGFGPLPSTTFSSSVTQQPRTAPAPAALTAPTTAPASQPQAPQQSQPQSATSSSHDWDAMFSGLESATPAHSNGTKDPFDFAPGPSSYAPATSKPSPPSYPPASSQQTAASKSSTLAVRPTPGRALSKGTEHDDPILKSLTGMGYQRDDALKALERFDYNIDKAADFLSSGK